MCAEPETADIATEFGFWELGGFAVEYKALFGESPSDTLRCGDRQNYFGNCNVSVT
jgi:AraC-like DNA-binding protein